MASARKRSRRLGAAVVLGGAAVLARDGRRRRLALMAAERASLARYEAIVEHGSDLIVLTDAKGVPFYVSPSLTHVLGYSATGWSAAGQSGNLVHRDDAAALKAASKIAAAGKRAGPVQTRVRHADGSWRHIEMTVVNLLAVPEVAAMVWTSRDVTDRVQAQEALAEQEASFRLLFSSNPEPMWVYHIDTLRFVEVNDAAVASYGYTRDEFLQMRITDIRPPEDQPALVAAVAHTADGVRDAGHWRHLTKSGDVRDVHVVSHRLPFKGRQCGLVLAQDITDQLAAEQALIHQALHDPLTGLPNRALVMDRLSEALRRSPHVGVVFLDIDRFKVINDGMGHTIGDRILALVAERLERALRPGDTVGRLGGDEFVVILDGVEDRDRAMAASSRLAWALDAPFHVNDADLFITVSQGVALAHADDSAEAVLSRADHAMYWAKDQGRARAEFADPHVVERAWTRFTLETSLRGAVDRGELVVHYQPLVELQNGAVVGAEALVRWQHPELGLLAPADFLPLAEETGLIVPIGEFVLQQALRDSGPWIEAAGRQGLPFDIAINISATQLAVPNLPFVVARALSASGVDASRVHLEITESVLMRDVERSIQILTALKELGVHIDIDDFGTGYSSLTYVQRLPVDRLKVDKSFVDRLTPAEDDSSIINAVLTLSRALHLDIIAEGVETPHQEKVLCDLGCGLAQGYLFAKPMEAAQFSDLVIEDRLEREAS